MLISVAEMEVLKIIGLYKDAPAKSVKETNGDILSELLNYGYIRYNKQHTSLRLTKAGAEILLSVGVRAETDAHPLSESKKLNRRLQSTEATFFFNSTGVNVFTERPPQKVKEPEYLQSSVIRRQNTANVLAMSKFIGLLYSETITYVVYNVTDPTEKFFPQNDEDIFRREIISANNPAKIIYLGSNLNEMVQSYAEKPPAKIKTKTVSNAAGFYQAIERFSTPVCFVPMDESGKRQLRIMLTENYKEKLTRYMLSVSYHSVLADFIDARYGNTDKYFIVFIDFDVKRLETALKMVPKLDILVLKEQVPALKALLKAPNARICSIKYDEAFEVLGIPPLEDKLLKPFFTEAESACVYASRYNKTNGGNTIEKNNGEQG